MTRWTIIALALVLAALAGVVIFAVRMLHHDRDALVRKFAAERQSQVQEAAREIAEDIDDVSDDLRFAGQLVRAADSAGDRERELGALLAVVRHYRLIVVFDQAGTQLLTVVDPLAGEGFGGDAFRDAMAGTARVALRRLRPGEIDSSPPIAGASAWFRVFATSLPPAPTGRAAGAIAVLVDTEPLFDKLRLVATEPASRLLLFGMHGQPLPASDPSLVSLVADLDAGRPVDPRVRALVRDMRAGKTAVRRLPEPQARALGLDAADAVAAFAAIPVEGGGFWTVATITSTATLRSHERAIALRFGFATGGIALCLIGFGAYVVAASRRAVAVRERLRNADALAHLHEKSEKILDHIPTGVMAISDDGRITALNRSLRDRIPGAAVGERLATAFHEAPAAVVGRLRALVGAAQASDRVKSLLGERLALFGAAGQYSIHAVPLEPRFPDARVLLVVEDLSEVRSLATQLSRAEKLATVGVLSAGIAHEIGTPLGIVRGRAEYVLGKLGTDHAQSAGLHVIVEQIDRVTRTIRQLLDFARVKPAAVRPVSVAPVARAVAELLRFEAERRKLTITVAIANDIAPVAADPDELQQVLVNLVMNACDACAEGGRVTVSATEDASVDVPAWARVRLEITDDGCGIPDEARDLVFDPFFTTKKRGQGTGLGLTMAAQIVRNHGGQIELESAPGRGTRVTLLWPTARAADREERHGTTG